MAKRLRAGILGYGRMGRAFVSAMQQNNLWEIAAVYDIKPGTRHLASRKVPGAKILASPEPIFLDPSIDVVGLFTLADARPHQIRQALATGKHDALLVGAGTILSDNPLLTDRSGKPRRRPLLRVILDSRLRLPLESRLVKSAAADRKNDVLVFCSSADQSKQSELEKLGVRIEKIPTLEMDGRPDLPAILRRLGELEITNLMIEGGATVNWAALAANVVDKVFLYYAPKILAGTGSVPFAAGAGFRHMSQAAYVRDLHLHRFGEDFGVEGYLRDPYGD